MADTFIKIIDDTLKAAVFTKFQSYLGLTTQSTDCVAAPKNIAQRMLAEKRGKASVEFISIWREGGLGIDWARQNTPLARRGVSLQYVDEDTHAQIITAKAVPVSMEYQVRLWSRDFDKINAAVEAYLLWLHSTPNLILNYNNLYPMEMYLTFGKAVDETDYDIYDKGKYFVYQLPIKLDGWILTTLNAGTVLTIMLATYLREGTAPNNVDTLLNEYTITTSSALIVPRYPEES